MQARLLLRRLLRQGGTLALRLIVVAAQLNCVQRLAVQIATALTHGVRSVRSLRFASHRACLPSEAPLQVVLARSPSHVCQLQAKLAKRVALMSVTRDNSAKLTGC